MIHQAVAASSTSNPLLPNGTLIAEFIAFIIILGVLWKWVLPPVSKAMTDRQNTIRNQFEELDEAKAAADAEREKYHSALTDAQTEAGQIRQKAREEGAQIVGESREVAKAESERIVETAHKQVEQERQQAEVQLRQHMGALSTELAGRIVGEALQDDDRQHAIVERFLVELESGNIKPEKVGSTSTEAGV
ncbi:F0F1 ATP synthase subunit B [Rudaeicoccus suwonensis]|uniref:ATP synthase subunit b n=1 Tax=Rudaeicoccus suwonensis TaxID=657409 RepID=A0A561DXA5_9MICO|nr:F0F1 ATP synthase subunit B [Rudaeicoccus suwonensis]TWE07976.1 ATP synthase F0 subcomplex B subunit [Rudaeicoccus suwonensis]